MWWWRLAVISVLAAASVGCHGRKHGDTSDAGNHDNDGADDGGVVATSTVWSDRASTAFNDLFTTFWFDEANLFYTSSEHTLLLNYWWQAHAFDVLVDEAENSNEDFGQRLTAHRDGLVDFNGGLTNDYYDDMEWFELALLRANALTGDETMLSDAKTIWVDIQGGWSDLRGGGISWNKTQLDYKNSPANLPAAIFAYRLYALEHDEANLDFANQIMDWLEPLLVDADTGEVWDGIGSDGTDNIDKHVYTYNQGTYIGAHVAAYEVTHDEEHLEKALKTAHYVMQNLVDEDTGVLKGEGGGDGGLFRGILVRYMAELALTKAVAKNDRDEIAAFLLANGNKMWEVGRTKEPPILFGEEWGVDPGNGGKELSPELSGMMLVEALAKLERVNALPAD